MKGSPVLLKHVNGLLRPDRGSVSVLGHPVSELAEDDLVGLRRKVSYIFQQGALFHCSQSERTRQWLGEHLDLEDAEVARRVAVLFDRVGLAGRTLRLRSSRAG